MASIIAWLMSEGWQIVAPVVLALIGGMGIYAKGRSDAAAKRDRQEAKEYQETMERITDAPSPVDADDARERMGARSKQTR